MIPERDAALEQLLEVRREIDDQMEVVREEAEARGIEPYKLLDSNGRFLYADLVVEKAKVVVALVEVTRKPVVTEPHKRGILGLIK